MEKQQKEVIKRTEEFVYEALIDESSGHDWWHILRVVNTTKRLVAMQQEIEKVDLFVCEMAALLHDIADEKLNESAAVGEKRVVDWLKKMAISKETQEKILTIILNMSYKGGTNKVKLDTIEGKLVQDADRLDALGAIGIARTFTYSGFHKRPMHDPRRQQARENLTLAEYRDGKDTAIMHFYEKLLKLKELMGTEAGRRLAEHRHSYMEAFLTEFYAEWDGEC